MADEKKVPKEKPEEKSYNWMGWVLGVIFLVAIGGLCTWHFWPEGKAVVVSLLEPTDGSSVQGPITGLKFSAEKEIKPAEIVCRVVNNDSVEIVGKFLESNKKAKEFRWASDEPIKAGNYYVKIAGKKIETNAFSFTVFEVEKAKSETSGNTSKEVGNKELYDKIMKMIE